LRIGYQSTDAIPKEQRVPVVLGEGIPFLAGVRNEPARLEDPEVTEAAGVTHLRYRVRRTP
jgi:hypothetical protein